MYIDKSTIKTTSGKSYTRYLLRQCYREGGKIKHKTIANLSACSESEIKAMQLALKCKNDLAQIGSIKNTIDIKQGKSIGAVCLLLEIAKRIGLTKILGNNDQGKLALWQVFSRVIEQGSRLSSVRLAERHACEILDLKAFDEDDLYANLDWLAQHQAEIEDKLFAQLNSSAQLFLYDVTSSYFEGECNELAEFGYNRDGKKGKLQIVVGLLCNEEGIPLSIEVFTGNTRDNKTLNEQIKKAAERFGVTKVTFVGDRGMIKSAQIEEIEGFNFHYITAITKPQLQTLIEKGAIQLNLFDDQLAEVAYEGVRYILRRNPVRAEELKNVRQDKLRSLQKLIDTKNEYLNSHTRAKTQTSLNAVKQYAQKLKISKWMEIIANDRKLEIVIDQTKLAEDSLFDGCYCLKTDLPKDAASKEIIHSSYKDLALVEQAFRTSKTVHLEMRPIYVRLASRTRGHIFVVMLAYRIIKELSKYWRQFDITVAEGIAALSNLCFMEVTINGENFNQIPETSELVKKLLRAANIELPKILPKWQAKVTTKRKLTERRKAF